MSKGVKKSNSLASFSALVYSTDPNYVDQANQQPHEETLSADQQDIRIWLETKHRGGKAVSAIRGFVGTDNDLQTLAKQLKAACGTGGTAKDGEILIQGDNRNKILQWLHKNGYSKAKKAGG